MPNVVFQFGHCLLPWKRGVSSAGMWIVASFCVDSYLLAPPDASSPTPIPSTITSFHWWFTNQNLNFWRPLLMTYNMTIWTGANWGGIQVKRMLTGTLHKFTFALGGRTSGVCRGCCFGWMTSGKQNIEMASLEYEHVYGSLHCPWGLSCMGRHCRSIPEVLLMSLHSKRSLPLWSSPVVVKNALSSQHLSLEELLTFMALVVVEISTIHFTAFKWIVSHSSKAMQIYFKIIPSLPQQALTCLNDRADLHNIKYPAMYDSCLVMCVRKHLSMKWTVQVKKWQTMQ